MTVKATVSLTERHHAYARQKAKEGKHGSVSSVVAAGLERLMQDEAEREIALGAMHNAIKERMAAPEKDWLDGVDGLFDKARAEIGK